jgi:4-hydroxy-tetrahydrodipicolinate reductase
LAEELGFSITSGVAAKAKVPNGIKTVDKIEKLEASGIECLIDFSLPEVTESVVAWCVKNKKPLVSGVTGVSADQKKLLEKAGEIIPVLWSPNMSLGVAVLARMLSQFSSLEEFDFQIEELHHKNKKDKPSGTALMLQERLKQAVKKPLPEPLAIRGGGIFGIHRIWAMGDEETITLEHTASSRRVFARGALVAARWLTERPAGVYTIDNVLG